MRNQRFKKKLPVCAANLVNFVVIGGLTLGCSHLQPKAVRDSSYTISQASTCLDYLSLGNPPASNIVGKITLKIRSNRGLTVLDGNIAISSNMKFYAEFRSWGLTHATLLGLEDVWYLYIASENKVFTGSGQQGLRQFLGLDIEPSLLLGALEGRLKGKWLHEPDLVPEKISQGLAQAKSSTNTNHLVATYQVQPCILHSLEWANQGATYLLTFQPSSQNTGLLDFSAKGPSTELEWKNIQLEHRETIASKVFEWVQPKNAIVVPFD